MLMALAIALGKLEAGQPANNPWIYTCGDSGSWVYWDDNGVIHFFPDIEDRYNPYTHEYQTLINGRWVSSARLRYWRIPDL
jgi:hypothetical protein